MSQPIPLRKRLFVSMCAMTRTTELAARRLGTARFLPALFVLRYANMGGLNRDEFARELAQIHSFRDDRWCSYWDAIADTHVDAAQDAIDSLSGETGTAFPSLLDAESRETLDQLAKRLSPAAPLMADHGPQASRLELERLVERHTGQSSSSELLLALIALDEIIKAITYFQVSAFPGGTPARMRAYEKSRSLSDVLVAALSPGLDIEVEPFSMEVAGETVTGYAAVPNVPGPVPGVLVTNGLEGTVQELLIPNMRHRDSGMALFVMEMPGTYAYTQPMSDVSEGIYDAVIDQMAQDPRIDAERIAMVGVSFGGYWSTRMAITNRRLRCAVSCGAPTHHSFQPTQSIGIPEVIVHAIAQVTGASNPIALTKGLRALSLRDRYASIPIPILVINGDNDTLLGTRDSVEIAEDAPQGELKLYPNDDHCAMGHYLEWLELTQGWLGEHLDAKPAAG